VNKLVRNVSLLLASVRYAQTDDIIDFVRESKRITVTLIRWGGAAAVLAGVSYAAAGYLDRPGMSAYTSALVALLSVSTPALCLGGLVGLGSLLLGGELSYAGRAGFLVGCLGTMLGTIHAVFYAVGLRQTFLELASVGNWWWVLFFGGLTLMGVAALLREELRPLGASVLTSGVLGWVSLLTDPNFIGVVVPMQPVHVAFAALFCLSSIIWGWIVFREASL
jgi:hypothetical protein